jgi:hypothetical protein
MPKVQSDLMVDGKPAEVLLEWGRLWRQTYQARAGIGAKRNFKAAAARLRDGQSWRKPEDSRGNVSRFEVLKGRVLQAAAATAATSQTPLAKPLGQRLSFLKRTQKGVFGSALHASMRASPYWNDQQERFLRLTVRKSALAPDHVPKATVRRAAPEAPVLRHSARIATTYADDPCARLPRGVVVASHPHAARDAELVLVPKMTAVFEPPAPAMCVHLTYAIGLGKAVACHAAWERAGRDPEKIRQGNIVWHQPACQRERVALCLGATTDRGLAAALRHVAGSAGSKWRVLEAGSAAVDAQARMGEALRQVGEASVFAEWLRGQRRILNTRGARAWTGQGIQLNNL